ncbi:cupin domain-containing protein [Cohnella algarum]|uniref:cupin domain-containing protein n=1 Tax=Cohnella algarum TaxID=2044859 RepID=UPI001967C6F9|nr:cupin domain-containing protein [Cohnella algarum]
MAVSYMDFTAPSVQFTYDLDENPLFKKDEQNYINSLSINQLNTLGNVSLLDIFLSKSNVVEPHIHQNASELVYCMAGGAIVSLINPFTKKLLNFAIKPGEVANVPQGWWHYEMATEDNTHLLAIFDAPVPDAIFASDMLRLTPASVMAHTYCLNEAEYQEAIAPIKQTVVIGPPADCQRRDGAEKPPVQGQPAQPQPQALSEPFQGQPFASGFPVGYAYPNAWLQAQPAYSPYDVPRAYPGYYYPTPPGYGG